MDKKEEHLKKVSEAKRKKQREFQQENLRVKKEAILKQKENKAKVSLILFIVLFALSYFFKGSFTDYRKIHPELLEEPIQTDTDKEDVTLNYKGIQYLIKPVKEYQITGLIVSHNNTTGFGDIYHDEKSFDTKDLCIIWGNNLKSNDFHKVKYWNVSWTCNWKYSNNIVFDNNKLSNNHLITAKESVRKKIGKVRVGDQIKITGHLANYTSLNLGAGWRNSSLTREDHGNNACEVILVDSIDVLKSGTPFWYLLYTFSKFGILLSLLLFIFFFVRPAQLKV